MIIIRVNILGGLKAVKQADRGEFHGSTIDVKTGV